MTPDELKMVIQKVAPRDGPGAGWNLEHRYEAVT